MSKVIMFPQFQNVEHSPAMAARRAIENRLGVSFSEFVGVNGVRTSEVQKKIDRALRKEVLIMASKYINN